MQLGCPETLWAFKYHSGIRCRFHPTSKACFHKHGDLGCCSEPKAQPQVLKQIRQRLATLHHLKFRLLGETGARRRTHDEDTTLFCQLSLTLARVIVYLSLNSEIWYRVTF